MTAPRRSRTPCRRAIGLSHNYAHYPEAVKWRLSFAMLTGSREVYGVLVLLSPAFRWRLDGGAAALSGPTARRCGQLMVS